jgi:ribonuclease HI
MELLGVIMGLKALKRPCKVTVVSDSEYVVRAVQQDWLANWQKKGWKTSDRKPVKNIDLWKQLLELLDVHEVNLQWVRGHQGHPENERCDQLAVRAREKKNLPPDEEYERQSVEE